MDMGTAKHYAAQKPTKSQLLIKSFTTVAKPLKWSTVAFRNDGME
jgi:hypothetical protein